MGWITLAHRKWIDLRYGFRQYLVITHRSPGRCSKSLSACEGICRLSCTLRFRGLVSVLRVSPGIAVVWMFTKLMFTYNPYFFIVNALNFGSKQCRCVIQNFLFSLPFFLCEGECYLMEWSDWSSCVNICVKEAGVDFGSVQARSRAVLAQEPENLQLCPDQVWESQPCTG